MAAAGSRLPGPVVSPFGRPVVAPPAVVQKAVAHRPPDHTLWPGRSPKAIQPASSYSFRSSTIASGATPVVARERVTRSSTATAPAGGGGIPARGPAPKTLNGEEIYNGIRPGISSGVRTSWWATQGSPVTCTICGADIDLTATGKLAKSIDHKNAVSDLVTSTEDHIVHTGGWHWRVVLKKDIVAIEDDESNFLPAHQGCNSGKGGKKGNDNLGPQKAKCPENDKEYNAACTCAEEK